MILGAGELELDPAVELGTPPGGRLGKKTDHRPCVRAARVTKKQFAMADLNSDEEMMVAAASYPLRGAGHHNIQCAGRKFSRTCQAGGKFRHAD